MWWHLSIGNTTPYNHGASIFYFERNVGPDKRRQSAVVVWKEKPGVNLTHIPVAWACQVLSVGREMRLVLGELKQ